MPKNQTKHQRLDNEYKRPSLMKPFKDKFHYNGHYNKFYYNPRYNYSNRWSYRRRKPPQPVSPPALFSGTEEHTQKKIQEASDMIKKRLLMPENEERSINIPSKITEPSENDIRNNIPDKTEERATSKSKKQIHYNVEEIQEKIVHHISNLNHGRKMNLICSNPSGYDVAIQQIQKQKRLELSKALRDMCSSQTPEKSDVINSIIPDIGIKIEELPLEVIRELSSSLDLNFEQDYECTENFNVEEEILVLEDDHSTRTISVQTETSNCKTSFEVDTSVNNLDEAIVAMKQIDDEIMRLTQMRQEIFKNLQEKQRKNVEETVQMEEDNIKSEFEDNDDILIINERDDSAAINFAINEKVLFMKIIEDTLLAATENGKVFYINTLNGRLVDTVTVCNSPITSLCYWSTKKQKPHLLVGAIDTKLYEYEYEAKHLVRKTDLSDYVQCMELAWQFTFIGTTGGSLLRYNLQSNKIEFEEKICDDSVMVLRATQEGARRVVLIGTRNAAVCVRDAMSGLHLRTMTNLVTPTVYCLLLENSLVYCGTTLHDILVFSFHTGAIVHKHQAANSKGISCMKIVQNLLFASCYNGHIYVYNIKLHSFVGVIEGPGGVILSMEIIKNIVIVGTMTFNFKSLLIPDYILEYNKI